MKRKGFPHVAKQTHEFFLPYYFEFEEEIANKVFRDET